MPFLPRLRSHKLQDPPPIFPKTAIAIPVVIVSKHNSEGRYPDYTKLNYTLRKTYRTERFFDNFHYRKSDNPTYGHVHYVDPDYQNLIPTLTDSVIIKVDTSVEPSSYPGRINRPLLHTTRVQETNTTKPVLPHRRSLNHNAGCGVSSGPKTFGPAFNAAGGGIMAVQWRAEGIRVWQFARAAIPADIKAGNPDPAVQSVPLADFPNTNCDIGAHFRNASIVGQYRLVRGMPCLRRCGVLRVHKCVGDWTKTNCTDFVANNPQAFANAYWEFGEFQIYYAS
ncbi:hypothetical protein MFIFM68171_02123 [Madurella fahalii]|uniref:Uncharacterized protein n=1 Tax=Madurella fahalii TaxID=1157608 RepID=A0ABQ0G2C3_9PEZI